MDYHFRSGRCIFYDAAPRSKHVYYSGKAEAAHGKILRHQMDSLIRFPGSFLLYFRRNYVPGKADPGKTCLVGPIEAAKVKLALSS